MSHKMFVNLPVRELERAVAFFARLGFSFDPRFTDAASTCMLVGTDAYVMLLEQARFKEFTSRPLGDSERTTPVIVALSAASRAKVDKLCDLAIAAGATKAMPPQDHGFMYGRSFYDLDGHHWEIFYMDLAAYSAKAKDGAP